MTTWASKVVLVTGGSAGLGLAIARAFAQSGARVIVVGRDEERLKSAIESLRAGSTNSVEAQRCDVTRDDDVQRLANWVSSEVGRLDVLVNNVGRSQRGRALETSLDEYRGMWEINFLTTVRCSQLFCKLLTESRGHIVNIGSLASKIAMPYLGAYSVSKFPLAAFSQQLRLELRESGVHVLLVCPGPIQRQDSGERYRSQAESKGLPEHALRPGGGAPLAAIDPAWLAERIRIACEQRTPELVIPWKVRWLCAASQLFPRLSDWILRKKTGA